MIIDKMHDIHMFKNFKDICKTYNITESQFTSIRQHSLRNYNLIHPIYNIYIQRLYVDQNKPILDRSKIKRKKYIIFDKKLYYGIDI